MPSLERDRERLLVDHRAARGVHEHRGTASSARAGARRSGRASRRERHVQRHDVGARQQVVEVGDPPGDAGVVARVVQHLHAEAGGAARDGLADAPEADDAERARRARRRRGSRFDAEARSIVPARRSASASDARRAAARIRRNARSAVVSSSTPGVLHTAMPSSVAVGDVDVVVTDRHVRRRPRSRGAPARSTRGVDAVGEDAHDRRRPRATALERARRGCSGVVARRAAPARGRRRRAGRVRRRAAAG